MKTARRLALLTCVATLVLIGVGALVRATGSGLGCPDWPTCHGGVVPPGDQGHQPLIEFSHRFVASAVGLLVIATAAFAWKYYRHVPVVAWMAVATVPAVIGQGLLGAVTVWTELPPEIVATHLLTAMLILSMQVVVIVGMYRADPDPPAFSLPLASATGVRALVTLALFAIVLWVGGYMAESGASVACEGWPLCNGGVLPASDEQQVTHMLHRYLAALLVLPIAWLVAGLWRVRGSVPWSAWIALSAAALYGAQVMIGAFNVWYEFPDALTVGHTAIAASLWLTLSAGAALGLLQPAVASAAESRSPEAATA
jgi:heme A synthase